MWAVLVFLPNGTEELWLLTDCISYAEAEDYVLTMGAPDVEDIFDMGKVAA